MNVTIRSMPLRIRARAAGLPLSGLLAASLLLAPSARAQTHACELLKASLSKRISLPADAYSLEAVPAADPVPPGAKVFGNCETGAYKVLFQRTGGGSSLSADTASPTQAEPARLAVAEAAPPKPAPAPAPAPPPAPAPKPAPAPAPAPKAVAPTPPEKTAGKPVRDSASGADRGVQLALATGGDAPSSLSTERTTQLLSDALDGAPMAPDDSTWGWYWLWALLALPIAGGFGAWFAHRRIYDEAGLPRGPKL